MPTPARGTRAILAGAFLVAAALAAVGCGGGGGNATPNPDLKVPEVPPGRGTQEKSGEAPKELKAKKT